MGFNTVLRYTALHVMSLYSIASCLFVDSYCITPRDNAYYRVQTYV